MSISCTRILQWANAIVVVNVHLGYNQENSLVMQIIPDNATSEQARKVLADLKDGTDTLYMGNICKTWTREQELEHQVSLIRDVSKKLFSEMGTSIGYKIGTMIEIPRAALVADEIAEQVEFFSFGTNDLTQMTFGYSRDDVGKFLPIYQSKGILQHDPFELLFAVSNLVATVVIIGYTYSRFREEIGQLASDVSNKPVQVVTCLSKYHNSSYR
ncbi:hypothetical protein Syun_027638 [Stephania yunnanensis]|uniref:PEP-utilising enzyme C-terminal domain-containing protein n=1 Tax=Stephania yunnanensis TaxID=152371 RepID=A0AAP0HQ46_9MAGN